MTTATAQVIIKQPPTDSKQQGKFSEPLCFFFPALFYH